MLLPHVGQQRYTTLVVNCLLKMHVDENSFLRFPVNFWVLGCKVKKYDITMCMLISLTQICSIQRYIILVR